MTTPAPLVGRTAELTHLRGALEGAREGEGSLQLIAGEAGVGKSRLAEEAAGEAELVLRGAAASGVAVPYGPIIDALRSRLRANPTALGDCGPLLPHLALLLPELGEPAAATERATLFEGPALRPRPPRLLRSARLRPRRPAVVR